MPSPATAADTRAVPLSALRQMDRVTQQNAALVEEAAAASESMQDQARSLERAVSVFKLETESGAASAAAAVTAARMTAARARQPALRLGHT